MLRRPHNPLLFVTAALTASLAAAWTLSWSRAQGPPAMGPAALATTSRAPGVQGPATAERAALLVGIDAYDPKTGFEGLTGAANDVRQLQHALMARFGFRKSEFRILLNDAATHAAIVRSFREWLIERAGPGTEAVFFFAGHGSRAPDASGAGGVETDRSDSTLVAADSRLGAPDISDDELHALLTALAAKTDRITVITDCCHSGGVTRGGGVTRRRFAPANRAPITRASLGELWPDSVPFYEDGHPRRSGALRWVHIAACRDTQTAHEFDDSGVLTLLLTDALLHMPRSTTYEQLARRLGRRMAVRFPAQDPSVVGRVERVVFSGATAARLPGFAARTSAGGRKLAIHAGTLHRVRRGSVVEVRDAANRRVGTARVTRVWATRSSATWIERTGEVSPATAFQVIQTESPPGDEPVTLLIGKGERDDAFAARIAKRAAGRVRVVREPNAGAAYRLLRDAGALRLETLPATRTLWSARLGRNSDGVLSGLLDCLAREVRFRALMELAETPGDIEARVELAPMPEDRLAAQPADGGRPQRVRWSCGAAVDAPDAADLAQLRVTVRGTRRPAFLNLLVLSEDRSVGVLWPPEPGSGVPVKSGETVTIDLEIYIDPAWPHATMRDRYLAIVTPNRADFSIFETPASPLAEPRKPVPVKRVATPLPALLEQACFGRVLRGGPNRFGIASLDVLVTREQRKRRKD